MTMESSTSTPTVLSIECLKGSLKADEWTCDMLQTGDVVEELRIGGVRWPFKNSNAGIQKILHSAFKAKDTSIRVRVRRGKDEFAELQACIVPHESAGKKQYMIRSIGEPSYTVGFVDRTEADCLALQASWISRMANVVGEAQLKDGYIPYPWGTRKQELLQVPNSSGFFSMLLFPKASDRVPSSYNDLEDTLGRASAWLNASQESGVPIVFMNIQTESLLTKISGDTRSSAVNTTSLSDLSNLANASLYGFEEYHGVDIGVVRAVRLWYCPLGGEVSVGIQLKETDSMLGFSISRTEEGFIFISSVIEWDDNAPSTRSGLSTLYKETTRACKLLVVSRVSNQKVLPWMVSSTGAVRCFDTVSLSQKLSLLRNARVPILLHFFLWDQEPASTIGTSTRLGDTSPSVLPLSPKTQIVCVPNEYLTKSLPSEAPSGSDSSEVLRDDSAENGLERDSAGESSSSFHGCASTQSSTDDGSECELDCTSASPTQEDCASIQCNGNGSESELDYTSALTTREVFNSKEELLAWVHEVGKKDGFDIVIRTSDYGGGLKLSCESNGQQRQKQKQLREDSEKRISRVTAGTKKSGCPFDLRAYKLKNNDWTLRVICGVHNHPGPAVNYLQEHSYAGSLITKEEEEMPLLVDMPKGTARPQERLGTYVNTLPGGLKPYISHINDVDSDGNCGFRAIAVSLGLSSWVQVRNDLISELNTHRDDYTGLYGSCKRIEELIQILSFFKDNPGKNHWMTMPDMGHLIASCYNIVLFHLSAQQCLTFLPLRSVPQLPILRREIATGFVNGNHFVQVLLKPGHPVPPIATNWHKFRQKCAEGWKNAYAHRIQKFIGIVSSSVATRETFDVIDL